MKKVHAGKASSKFSQPSGIVTATICRTSGKKASGRCTDTYSEIFVEGTVPGECDAHSSSAKVCSETLLLATEYCPEVITKYYSYTVEKERLGLWKNLNSSVMTPPADYCPVHTKANTVSEASAPKITLNGNAHITLNVGDTYTEQGAKATDEIDGDITSKILPSGVVSTYTPGTYTVKYTVTNSKGKTATATRTIIVKEKEETTKPTKTTEEPKPSKTDTETSNTPSEGGKDSEKQTETETEKPASTTPEKSENPSE